MITNPRALRWLKLAHIICAAVWLGCSASLNILKPFVETGDPGAMRGFARAMLITDNILIYWGVCGVLLTGLIYGIWTKWGFFRLFWLRMKWLLSALIIISGTFITGPAIKDNVQPLDWYSQNLATWQQNLNTTGISGMIQLALLLIIFYLSVMKPTQKKG